VEDLCGVVEPVRIFAVNSKSLRLKCALFALAFIAAGMTAPVQAQEGRVGVPVSYQLPVAGPQPQTYRVTLPPLWLGSAMLSLALAVVPPGLTETKARFDGGRRWACSAIAPILSQG